MCDRPLPALVQRHWQATWLIISRSRGWQANCRCWSGTGALSRQVEQQQGIFVLLPSIRLQASTAILNRTEWLSIPSL